MHQSRQFLDALKSCLKAKGVTYKALAEKLGISETSVKRNFSEGTLSLSRAGEILEALDLNFSDVTKIIGSGQNEKKSLLSFDQESVLASDKKLFAFFNLLLFGKSPQEIMERYVFRRLRPGVSLAF